MSGDEFFAAHVEDHSLRVLRRLFGVVFVGSESSAVSLLIFSSSCRLVEVSSKLYADYLTRPNGIIIIIIIIIIDRGLLVRRLRHDECLGPTPTMDDLDTAPPKEDAY
jgi:hypothetical protein